MCGIVGALDLRGQRGFPPERLEAMSRAVAHRGPDDQHAHNEPGLAMAVRRLATVDVHGGRQPLSSEDGRVWVAFNGDLFEYPQRLPELAQRGHRLGSCSDTEAWVHLYEDQGEGVFEHARGQFAVALWDSGRRILFLARDRLGVRPLFYAEADGWLLWASEIKGLFASGLIRPEPDLKGLDDAFTFYATSNKRTVFQGIRPVTPGHYLRVRDGRVEQIRYWDLDYPDAGDEICSDDIPGLTDQLEHLVRQAIRRRLRGDVPVANCLSGGLDSSLILAFAIQENNGNSRAFSIGLGQAGPDERSKADFAARTLGCPLTTRNFQPHDIAEAYPELIRTVEFPDPVTSDACMMRLMEVVQGEGYRAVFVGEGTDEAMCGHHLFKAQRLHSMFGWHFGRIGYRLLGGGLRIQGSNGSARRTPFRALAGVRTARQLTFEVSGRGREILYTPDTWNGLENHDPFDDLDLANPRLHRWHPLNQAAYVEYKTFLPGLLLVSGDRIGMRSSVKMRRPFLDEDLLGFCARLHPKYKLRNWNWMEKWLLRRVAERVLPNEISWLRKQGLQTHLSSQFLGPDRPAWVDELLSPASLRASGYFDPQAVLDQRARLTSGRLRFLPRLIADVGITFVIATQLWHHTFFGGGLADLPCWSPPECPVGAVR